ncbi:hypothetical protein AX16_004441 [Volvariella volvacea WC 439]|nr:hypothetical protein AX16_004441 [Volvariella volvacea WC 439]
MYGAVIGHFHAHSLLYGVLVVTLVPAYLILHQLVLKPRFFSTLRNVPGPPLADPILSHFETIIQCESGIPMREWAKQYGPVVRTVGPVGRERLMFMKPEALHQILVKDWLDYPRPRFLRNLFELVTGYGLLTVTGDEHRQMRKAMNPAFSVPHLIAQTGMLYGPIYELIDILGNELDSTETGAKILPMYDWLSKATLDIICETAFGYKTDSLRNPHNELAEAYERLKDLQSGVNLGRAMFLMSIPGLTRLFNSEWAYNHRHWFEKAEFLSPVSPLIESMHTIRVISTRMLEEKVKESIELSSDTEAKRDFMSILVRARRAELADDKSNYAMSDEAMKNQVLTFLGAGHETTASGLTWALWLLANDPQSQRRLREEVTSVITVNPSLDYRTLRDLKWLNCVVMEGLRVLPPVPVAVRVAAKTGHIQDTLVPEGTMIYIPIRALNTWKATWGEDAEEFRPSRWLELPKEYDPTFALFSFITGPHACIGRNMSIIEMKAVLACLIANFEFEPAYPGQTIKPEATITMKPTDGMPLRLRRVVHA